MEAKERPTAAEIRRTIAEEGSVTGAARRLGVSRPTLYKWMRALAIAVERRSRAA